MCDVLSDDAAPYRPHQLKVMAAVRLHPQSDVGLGHVFSPAVMLLVGIYRNLVILCVFVRATLQVS